MKWSLQYSQSVNPPPKFLLNFKKKTKSQHDSPYFPLNYINSIKIIISSLSAFSIILSLCYFSSLIHILFLLFPIFSKYSKILKIKAFNRHHKSHKPHWLSVPDTASHLSHFLIPYVFISEHEGYFGQITNYLNVFSS